MKINIRNVTINYEEEIVAMSRAEFEIYNDENTLRMDGAIILSGEEYGENSRPEDLKQFILDKFSVDQ